MPPGVVRTRKKPEGEPLLPLMPCPVYKNMTDEDLESIYEYLPPLKPSRTQSGRSGGDTDPEMLYFGDYPRSTSAGPVQRQKSTPTRVWKIRMSPCDKPPLTLPRP